MAIFINPPPTSNPHHKLNAFIPKTQKSSPTIGTNKKSATFIYNKKSMIIGRGDYNKNISPKVSTFKHEALVDNSVYFHQTAAPAGLPIHTLINRLSKWVIGVTFGGLILVRHDALAFWAAMGSVSNFILSYVLKQILKQKRPVSGVSLGPGMPSSHAQTIFFSLVFVILSVVEWMGSNGLTMIFGLLLVSLGSYFSWLRVSLRYHTTNQVVAGIIAGSVFSGLWFWAWEAMVHTAYKSNLWVQILIIVGAACYYLGFIFYLIWHLRKD